MSDDKEIRPFIPADFCDRFLSPAQFRVLCQIARRGFCWESIPTMARACVMSAKTVRAALHSLRGLGFVYAEEKPGRSTTYRITPLSQWAPLPKETTGLKGNGSPGKIDRGPSQNRPGHPSQNRPDDGSPRKGSLKGDPVRECARAGGELPELPENRNSAVEGAPHLQEWIQRWICRLQYPHGNPYDGPLNVPIDLEAIAQAWTEIEAQGWPGIYRRRNQRGQRVGRLIWQPYQDKLIRGEHSEKPQLTATDPANALLNSCPNEDGIDGGPSLRSWVRRWIHQSRWMQGGPHISEFPIKAIIGAWRDGQAEQWKHCKRRSRGNRTLETRAWQPHQDGLFRRWRSGEWPTESASLHPESTQSSKFDFSLLRKAIQ